jgi:hypothetical protein
MLANAVFVAIVIFLALAFTLMGQLRFLIPWRALLWHEYWRGILFYCFLLFTNISRPHHLGRAQALATRYRTETQAPRSGDP